MTWIQTAHGRKFDFLHEGHLDICIEDIAHALSHICRFNGHTCEFYSVAQHSVLVCDNVMPSLRFEALLHDAHEAYIGDWSSPLKECFSDQSDVARLYEKVKRRVRNHFEVPWSDSPYVKDADIRALITEARDLLNNAPIEQWTERFGLEPFLDNVDPLGCKGARELFLDRYHMLNPGGASHER